MSILNLRAVADTLRIQENLPALDTHAATLAFALVHPVTGAVVVKVDPVAGALITPAGSLGSVAIVTTLSPTTGFSRAWNAVSADEFLNLTPAGTLSTGTLVFPTNANSRIGEKLSVTSSQIITALTISAAGLTINGLTPTSLQVGQVVSYIKTAASTWQRTDVLGQASGQVITSPVLASPSTTGSTTIGGPIVAGSSQALSGAGAVDVTHLTTKFTSTGSAQALTIADGTDGQIKTIAHVVDGGSGVLTPATKTGFTTVTFTSAGDTVTLQFFTTVGWMVIGSKGVTIA